MSDRRTTQQLTRSLARRLGFGDSGTVASARLSHCHKGAGAEEQTESLLSMDPEMLTNAFLHVPPPEGEIGLFKVQESALAPRGGRVASRFVPDSLLEGRDSNPRPFARNPAFLRLLQPRSQPICTPIMLHFAPLLAGELCSLS
jgi:hypothetical protein